MRDSGTLTLAFLSVLLAGLLVLPGLGVRTVLRVPARSGPDELLFGVGVTPFVAAAVGVVLLGFGVFSGTVAGVVLGVFGVLGLPRAFVILADLARRPLLIVLAVLAAPFAWSATWLGGVPARTFQWYYWNLGRQLGSARGVPAYVMEYGHPIRWLPDYVVFNVMSEAYRGLTPVGTSMAQIAAWRVPVALLGTGVVYAAFRRYVDRVPALVGVAVLVPSTWFLLKFNAYKPEAYGAVLGVAALVIAVDAVRQRRSGALVFAGALIGLDLAVHAIAATAMGGAVVVATVVELVAQRRTVAAETAADTRRLRRTRRSGMVRTAFVAAGMALFLTVAIGWVLQGRALVFLDAGHPSRGADGTDPTLVYSRFSSGNFAPNPTIRLSDELARGLERPWPGVELDRTTAIVMGVIVLVGCGLATASRPRRLVAVLVGFVVLLAGSAVYSAVAYDTYVPRHTGLSRTAQYWPFAIAGFVAVAAHGFLRALRRRSPRATWFVVSSLLVVVTVGACTRSAWNQLRADTAITSDGEAVLGQLATAARVNDVILSNVGTRGLMTFRTDAVNPLEGRQAFLESDSFLRAANQAFLETRDFFTTPGGTDYADRLGADWVLASTDPYALGAVNTYATPAPTWMPNGFELIAERGPVRLFRRVQRTSERTAVVGPARDLIVRSSALVIVAGIAAAAVHVSRRRRGADGTGGHNGGRFVKREPHR